MKTQGFPSGVLTLHDPLCCIKYRWVSVFREVRGHAQTSLHVPVEWN